MMEPEIDIYTEPDAVNRRFWRHLLITVAIGVAAAAMFGGPRFAGGVLLGGGLAMLNFRWLLSSVNGVLAVGSPKVPPGTTMMFMLRWVVIAAIAYAAHRVFQVKGAAIIAGLLAPALAVLLEAGYLTFRFITHRRVVHE
jgi:hypothetical protein